MGGGCSAAIGGVVGPFGTLGVVFLSVDVGIVVVDGSCFCISGTVFRDSSTLDCLLEPVFCVGFCSTCLELHRRMSKREASPLSCRSNSSSNVKGVVLRFSPIVFTSCVSGLCLYGVVRCL